MSKQISVNYLVNITYFSPEEKLRGIRFSCVVSVNNDSEYREKVKEAIELLEKEGNTEIEISVRKTEDTLTKFDVNTWLGNYYFNETVKKIKPGNYKNESKTN